MGESKIVCWHTMIGAAFVGFIFATTTTVFAARCAVEISPETWVKKVGAEQREQAQYLAALKNCLSANEENQGAIDAFALQTLSLLDKFPADRQAKVANFTKKALELNANTGYASSQHNLACLYNDRPGSLLAKFIKQDQMKFGYWTKMAASQSEPRAVFNLAMRMAVGIKEASIERDLETAYKLLVLLERLSPNSDLGKYEMEVFREMKPFIAHTKASIEGKLGKKRAKRIAEKTTDFSYATLAPTRKLLNSYANDKGSIQ